jgi:hypothetical protein
VLEIKNTALKGSWKDVFNSARTTIGLEETNKNISDEWKKRILLAEHSPIRQLIYKWKWYNLPYWVSVHFVRHWLGILHFVKSQRDDRRKNEDSDISRNNFLQSSPVNHECEANIQSLINISRKRLCFQASKETRNAWIMVVEEIKKIDSVSASVLVPECIYRGFCPEMKTCGYCKTEEYLVLLEKYRKI